MNVTTKQAAKGTENPKGKPNKPLVSESNLLIRRTPTNAIFVASTGNQSVKSVFSQFKTAAIKRRLKVYARSTVGNEWAFLEDMCTEFEAGTAKAVERIDILKQTKGGEVEHFGFVTLIESNGVSNMLEITPSHETTENALAVLLGKAIGKNLRKVQDIKQWGTDDISWPEPKHVDYFDDVLGEP